MAEREAKSVSVEDTYDIDLVERRLLEGLLERQAQKVAARLRSARLSGRTVTVKVRLHDFTTHTRSTTLAAPTDEAPVIFRLARTLLAEVDTLDGVRLLGVGVSGLADWIQEDLFADDDATERDRAAAAEADLDRFDRRRGWHPGMDVVHAEHGQGWVWGSGVGRVTVRFETAETRARPGPDVPSGRPGAHRPPAAVGRRPAGRGRAGGRSLTGRTVHARDLHPYRRPMSSPSPTPPVAARIPHERTHHGDTFVDDYEWLRDKESPDTLAYLEAENSYTESRTAHLEQAPRAALRGDPEPHPGDRPLGARADPAATGTTRAPSRESSTASAAAGR